MWLSQTMYLTILFLHLAPIALCSTSRSLLNTTATTTTPSPPAYCSSAHQFYCRLSDKCIPAAHRCDGNPNCNGNEDELGCIACTNVTASQMNMFYCESSKKCISIEWKCDGADDCGNNEDESSCGTVCENGKRSCGNGHCIDEDWWCDTQADCSNGADEANCTQECASNQIKCSSNGTEHEHCISSEWRCDGAIDCPNGEDEAGCTLRSCSPAHFMCTKENRCIPERWRCDNDSDCEDGEDEKDCGLLNTRHPQVNTCTQLEFACASGAVSCILKGWQCDGAEDCSDGSDEHGCGGPSAVKCRPGQFQCATSHECIPSLLLCSGKAECADGSDEMHSTCADSTKRYCNLTAGEFSCVEDLFGSTCVTLDQVCDHSPDCPSSRDESDEFCSPAAPATQCRNDTCGQTARCVDVLNSRSMSVGTECKCPSGYFYNKRFKECQDINECLESGPGKLPVCDQVCVNTNGSYKCECELNYYLQGDGRSCKTTGVIPKLLFTNRHQIQSLHMHKADIYVSLIDSKAAVAIDFDYEKKTVFFSDMMQKKIFQFKMPSEEHEEDLHSVDLNISGIQTPDGLAYDWVYEHLYWTDTASNTINMACLGNGSDVSGQRMTTVLYSNEDPSCVQRNSSVPGDICIDEPRALVLYPHKGWMFWSDWGQNPNIIKAAIDGSHKEKLVYNTENKLLLVWPNGLTLDISASGSERLYWIDAKLFSVFSCSLKNCMNDANVLAYDTDNIKHPFSITVFENQLFWSDWHHQRIVSANKFTGRNVSHILTRLEQPMDLKVFHPVSQPKGQNFCGLVAAEDKCQHICVPKPWQKEAGSFVPVVGVKHTCLCANGFRLAQDGRSCISVQTEKPIMNNNHNHSAVAVKGSQMSEPGLSVGVIAGIASSAVFLTGASVFSILFIVLRRIRSNKSKSMNFDNPIYKRTTEDKLELPRHEYQPSQTIPAAMVPLTAAESTEMSHDDYDV